MKLPGFNKPVQTGRLEGLSSKTHSGIFPKKETTPASNPSSKHSRNGSLIPRNLFHGISIYLALIKSDIKKILKIDEKTRLKKQEYEDFMEEHFGKDFKVKK